MSKTLRMLTFFPIAALAASRFESPQMPVREWPDTEASTNLVFDTGSVGENRWDMTLEIDGTASNNLAVEFGRDADGDGRLSADERELSVGWDCGAWFVRDARAGTMSRVPAKSGRRRLEWTLSLGRERKGRSLTSNVFPALPAATLFNPDWNLVRVVIRGKDAANELVQSRIRINPFVVHIR